jgi:hypothetical protein
MNSDTWTISEHAADRHRERLPEQDLFYLLNIARRASPQQIKRIKRSCPEAAALYMRGFHGRYFLVARNRYVFVVEPPQTLISCWDWYATEELSHDDLDRIEARKPKAGSISLNEKEFYGLINLARKGVKG